MKIAVVGIGYVGLSIATLLSKNNDVTLYDINEDKIKKINNGILPIKDNYLKDYLCSENIKLKATNNYKKLYKNSELVIVCTSTNFIKEKNSFDISSIEETISNVLEVNKSIPIIIKSTVPVGCTNYLKNKYDYNNIIFSPEFLREGSALYDNLYPSRIIIGDTKEIAKKIAELMKENCLSEDVKVLFMDSSEAEAVKLFSNTYLAMRVSFFNELDTFAELNNLDSKNIIEGVCSDDRIGNYYNNPSFGYGGYCLPKDTKQLLANYNDLPQKLISAIIESNNIRKKHIADSILKMNERVIGIYKLAMKSKSDNFRESAILDVINILKEYNKEIIIYEPLIYEKEFMDCEEENNLENFISKSDLIVANRNDETIKDVKKKIYTRDLFKNN